MAEKAIHTAISIVNGYRKIENIYELLRGRKGFEVRTQFNTQNIDFECCECEQSLCISYIDTNVYLKHKPNSESCILKDGHDKDLI